MISVATKPGCTELNRTPAGPYSSAALRIMASIPALATG